MYEAKSRIIRKSDLKNNQDLFRLEPYFLEANCQALADYYNLEILEIELSSKGEIDRVGLFFLGNIDEKRILFSGGRFGYLGFQGDSSTCFQNYYPCLLELAKDLKVSSLSLSDRGCSGIIDSGSYNWVCSEVNYLVATVKDNVDEDGLYFPNSKRRSDITRNLKKAYNCGLSCRTTKSIEKLSIWYKDCHLPRMQELGGREWDLPLLKSLVNNGTASLILVEDMQGFIRGGCLIVESNTDIELFMMSSNSEWQRHGVNYILTEYIYKMAYGHSKSFINWQASNPPNGSVATFKKRWGAVNVPFYNHSYLLDVNITTSVLQTKAPDFFVFPYSHL